MTILIGAILCIATVASGEKRNCGNCIPVADPACPNTLLCGINKRSIDVCPPCIPRAEVEFYKMMCPSTPVCLREKRSSQTCPPCIPFNEQDYYKDICRGKPFCVRTKRSVALNGCPICIPLMEIEVYKVLIYPYISFFFLLFNL